MIQDIYPSKLDNTYHLTEIDDDDLVLEFDTDGRILAREDAGELSFINGSEAKDYQLVYLFSLDDRRYFLLLDTTGTDKDGYAYHDLREIRDTSLQKDVFIVFTAYHLWRWYIDNRFCGRCADRLIFHEKERALRCPKCGNVIYPRINPAVIVGVIKGDCLLITKYRQGYSHSALIAGFTEIGETLEETVHREVMEETGIKVKNVRYYKSQPWGMAQDILVGFFCEADGDDRIKMDEGELKYAAWVKKDDIELQPNNLSLTNEMMKVFKENEEGDE